MIRVREGSVLFVHEVHKVVGKRAAEFEDAYRSGWMPELAQGSDARLLWYFDLAHGSGLAYRAVTVTAVRDGAAWARLAERVAAWRPASRGHEISTGCSTSPGAGS